MSAEVTNAFERLSGSASPDIAPVVEAILAVAGNPGAGSADVLDSLVLLRWAQSRLAELEPRLIDAARAAGRSWQELAPALGVASRQAAERRYLRLVPATAAQQGTTRDDRVRAERDRRAGRRAVARWANDNTADLRRLAGQITALTDLAEDAAADVGRLHRALGDPDAAALPRLLDEARLHLGGHPDLADEVDKINDRTGRVRRQTQRKRDAGEAVTDRRGSRGGR
jgi:hypothetical protein